MNISLKETTRRRIFLASPWKKKKKENWLKKKKIFKKKHSAIALSKRTNARCKLLDCSTSRERYAEISQKIYRDVSLLRGRKRWWGIYVARYSAKANNDYSRKIWKRSLERRMQSFVESDGGGTAPGRAVMHWIWKWNEHKNKIYIVRVLIALLSQVLFIRFIVEY